MPVLFEGVAQELSLTGALTNITTAASSVMTFITNDNFLMTLFCGSIVGLAFSFIRKAKKTARA